MASKTQTNPVAPPVPSNVRGVCGMRGKNVLTNKMLSAMTKNQLITLVVTLVVITIGALYYLYRCIRSSEIEYFEPVGNSKETVFRMFRVTWCGFCKRAKPAYMKFMQEHDGKTINGRLLKIEMVDCEENKHNANLAKAHGVTSYPTFVLSDKGGNRNYEGDERTPKATLEGQYLINS